MALRVGLIGSWREASGLLAAATCVPLRGCVGRTWLGPGVEDQGFGVGGTAGWLAAPRGPHPTLCQWAINNQLRTGADKGTPTV